MARKKTPPEYGESDCHAVSVNAFRVAAEPRSIGARSGVLSELSEVAFGITYRTHDGRLPVEL